MKDMSKRRITITEGSMPEFYGTWTVAEVRQVAEFLLRWLDQLEINKAPDDND